MKIVAHRGNRLHAPENTRASLVSAYTAGADALELDVQLTKDGELVVSQDASLERVAGEGGPIIDSDLAELRELDVSASFAPRGAKGFTYTPAGHGPVRVETLPSLLDALPAGVTKLIELGHESTLETGRREELVEKVMDALLERRLLDEVILYSKDSEALRLARERAPYLRICTFDWERSPGEQVDLMEEMLADGLVVEHDAIFGRGQLNEIGERIARLHSEREFRVGAVVYMKREEPVFTDKEFKTLRKYSLVYSIATDSMLDVAPFTRDSIPHVEETFEGTDANADLFALGLATAGEHAEVLQDDGVNVKVGELDGGAGAGGGLSLVPGIEGDFAAEVDYEAGRTGPGVALELSVSNVAAAGDGIAADGGSALFRPRGGPPFAGIELGGDDGPRIVWNLGAHADSDRRGPPAGAGGPSAGRLRIERRGPWFSAYFRSEEAPDWVCAGVVRNDSLNPLVFLRCVAGSSSGAQPDGGGPLAPVEFAFRNLLVSRYPAA